MDLEGRMTQLLRVSLGTLLHPVFLLVHHSLGVPLGIHPQTCLLLFLREATIAILLQLDGRWLVIIILCQTDLTLEPVSLDLDPDVRSMIQMRRIYAERGFQ